jgi:DNA polymerase-1
VELQREITGDGPSNAQLVVLTALPSYADLPAHKLLSDYSGTLLFDQFRKAGLLRSRIRVESVCERIPPGRAFYALDADEQRAWREDALERIRALSPSVVVPLGDLPLEVLTGGEQTSSDKWQLSVIPTLIEGTKAVPLISPERVVKVFKDIPFLTFGAKRAAEEATFRGIRRTQRIFHVEPTLDETLAFLQRCERAEWLSVDIETGRGQITCVGFSYDSREALCVPTLPDAYDALSYHVLWSAIARALASPAKKVFQNGIHDTSYFAKYGIRVLNFAHDTMVAQKFLFPELPMGLDTVARIYTREPYWKDDAKDWSVRQDIRRLYEYNCRDAAVTLEAAHAQRADLKSRGLLQRFDDFLMRLTAPVAEMCWRGLPLDVAERERLRADAEAKIAELRQALDAESTRLVGRVVNPRSPTQVKSLLVAAGYKLPTKFGAESSDREALLKLRLKHPESKILTPLIRLSAEQKKVSSYLTVPYDEADSRIRYTLSLHGTESGRMSCYTDPWGRGLNAQTIPAKLKSMFCAPAGSRFVEVDLSQAESRFVAFDGPVPVLQRMYADGVDVHRWVASHAAMFNKPMSEITYEERQLGKKTGHASNYGMGAATLSNQCLKEMDLVLPVARAQALLDGYHVALDNGILRWQARIREEVLRKRMLRTPFGRERYFYDRPGPELWKEAYAYRPQSAVTDVINHLVLHMFGHARLLLQIHDSLLLEVPDASYGDVVARIRDQDAWNPRIALSGGELRIPIEIKTARRWSELEKIFAG